jgi:hypothetical protein
MIKRSLTAAALAAVLFTPAFAQSPASDAQPLSNNGVNAPNAASSNSSSNSSSMATIKPGPASFVQNQKKSDWRSSKLIGTNVYGPDNSKIGDINDVLISSNGNVNAVVIGVGGFLGVGEKNVALPFDTLTVARKDDGTIDKVSVSYSKDDLKNAPKFAFYQVNKPSETTGSNQNGNATNNMKR